MLQQIFMNVLLQVIDLLDVRIVLVINVIRHEVHCLQAALNLTQVHLCKNGSVFCFGFKDLNYLKRLFQI